MPEIKYYFDENMNRVKPKPFCFRIMELAAFLMIFFMVGLFIGNRVLPSPKTGIIYAKLETKTDSIMQQNNAILGWFCRDRLLQDYIKNSGHRAYLQQCDTIYRIYQKGNYKSNIKFPTLR